MRYLLVTEPGLEPIAAEEAVELWPGGTVVGDRAAIAGLVRLDLDGPLEPARLRTVSWVALLHHEAAVGSLDDLRRAVAGVEVPELDRAPSFRVTAHLHGQHPFTTDQAAGAAGAALQRRHRTPVDLERFAVEVRLDLRGPHLLLGVQLHRDSLGRRIRRGRPLRGAVKPTVAAAMVRVAGASHGRARLLDPLCGGGTIPVEAKLLNPELRVAASDWDAETVEAARATIANHGVDVDLRLGDARHLERVWDERFEAVVTNPPWGQRLGRRVSLARFYRQLLLGFLAVLAEPGRLVILTPRVKALQEASRGLPIALHRQERLETGGMRPAIHLFERV